MTTPPETERDPVTETLHGEEFTDPYRWLEEDSEAVADWERRQNEYTDSIVHTDSRDTLEPDFEAVGRLETYFLPTVSGGRYFQRIEAADAEQPALTVRETVDGQPRTLIGPDAFDETTNLQWFVPGPDGDRLLYGLTEAGTEQYDLEVLDVDSEEVIDRVGDVGRCGEFPVAWLDDGFYYMATGSAEEGGQLDKELRYHEVDGDDRQVTGDIPQEQWPQVQVDRETGLVVLALGELASDSELYALVDGELEPVVTDIDAAFDPVVANGRVYVQTNHGAPRGAVLAASAEEFASLDGPEGFETVIPEGEDVIAEVEPAGDGFAVHRIREARSVVSLHDGDGEARHELSLPEFAGVPRVGLAGEAGAADLFVQITGMDRPQSVVHADVGPDATPDDWQLLQRPTLPERFDPAGELDLTVERLWVDSTDETSVPVYVVHRADIDPDGDAPAVLYGYGGFRIPLLPSTRPYRLPFLADGGVFALACLRGGLEFGEEWHEAGAREHKEHTFDDFEAAARALVEAGYTSHDRLAARGGSNGGLTVGAALTRDPDLFGAVVSNVPLLDMLRFHEFLLGEAWTGEYGSPEDPEAFAWLRSYSPYHNVDERPYPATLFATAAGDSRVHPAHARKMTARVQHATTGDDPVCYRSVDETGHGVGTPTSLEIQQALDKWAFVYEALGIERAD
jgi:prolyl oligopeptidase